MSYDLLIKNGTVVDGTGAPRYRADVAVANGQIAEIGKVTTGAKKVIDASDLVNVEAIPFDVLSKGITWEWVSFPEYMNAAQKRGSGINLGFMAPLTPFRHFVMGEASMERAAKPEETAQIKALIKEAVAAGAFGFTTTNVAQHIGYKGRPIACRNASWDE